MDVAPQERDADDLGVRHLADQGLEMVLLAAGDELEVGQVGVVVADGASPPASSARSRAASARLGAKRGCIRLTMSALTAMSASANASAKYTASSRVSRRGEATSTKWVTASLSRASTWRARLRKPSSMPWKAWKKAMASSMTSEPTTLDTVRRKAWAAMLAAFMIPRVGAMTTL